MTATLRAALLGLTLLASAPLLAQASPPPREMMRPGGGPFAAMSREGRRAIQDARHDAMVANRADSDRVAAARGRMLDLVGAERFDAAAFKRAMDDERDAAQAMKARQQGAMLGALQRLSASDRRTFADESRMLRARVEGRLRGGRRAEGMPPL